MIPVIKAGEHRIETQNGVMTGNMELLETHHNHCTGRSLGGWDLKTFDCRINIPILASKELYCV